MSRFISREDLLQLGRGILMGGADVVPGVSGGTVALVLGIYERLVTAISHVDATWLRQIRDRNWSAAAAHVDLRFLVALACGIAVGIVTLASLIHELLAHHRSYTLAAFFGLILASAVVVARMIGARDRRARLAALAYAAVGAALAFWVVSQGAVAPHDGLLYTFLCGSVAICAMILPGISGAYILLLLGKYVENTGIVKRLAQLQLAGDDLTTLAVFAAGCVVGLLIFSKLLRRLLARWHAQTLALLCGMMIGSLYKIWPLQIDTTPDVLDLERKVFEPYWPQSLDGKAVLCAAIATAAALFVLAIDYLARRRSPQAAQLAPGESSGAK